MKRTFSHTILVIISLAVILGGCSVPPVSSPAASTGAVTTLQVTLSASSIASGGTATVTATVTNASAQAVPNVSVSFSVISATAGAFTPITVITNAAGQAVSTFNANAVNVNATIRATVTVGASTINGSAPITIGTPPRIPTSVVVLLAPSTINPPPGSTTVTATVTDASGGIPGLTVTFTVSDNTTGNFSSPTGTTDAAGVATVTFTANAAVNAIVNITATSTLSNSASLTIGVPPAPTPASMSLTINPLSMSISAQAAVSVTLLDASGNPAYNNPVTLTITTGTTLASFNPMPSAVLTVPLTTNASGIASAIIYAGTSSGTVTVTATSAAGNSPKTASILLTSSPASLTLNVVNSNLINGQTTNITADVRNLANNPVSDGTQVNFAITSLPPVAGALSATAASTVNGIASVTFTADASITGGVIIQATAGTAPADQKIIIVSSAQAGSLEFVSATPNVINIVGAGTSSSTVIFKVLSSTGAPLGSQSVNFTLNGPSGATLTGGSITASGSTNAQGEVTTTLTAGSVAGPCRIVATTTVPGPPVVTLTASSGAISIGGGVPSDRFFSVAVSKFNLDGFGCNNLQSTISAYLADRFGNYNILQGTSVSFFTDSGAIDTSNITDATGITTSVFRTQSPMPADVTPIVGEPNYTFGGHTYNPRDGWLTILVSTTGEEYFQDDNGNGVYDLGEPFTDLAEPFIDSNDNGTRDTGELFFDWPAGVTGNTIGTWNGPNSVWDARIPIFREVNLVMTGPPNISSDTSRITDSTFITTNAVSIPKGSSAVFYVFVSDINLNALISGTKISLAADQTDAKITPLSGPDPYTLADGLSFGPTILQYSVMNNNAGVAKTTNLTATIDWPGNCGRAGKSSVVYSGTVTLQ